MNFYYEFLLICLLFLFYSLDLEFLLDSFPDSFLHTHLSQMLQEEHPLEEWHMWLCWEH